MSVKGCIKDNLLEFSKMALILTRIEIIENVLLEKNLVTKEQLSNSFNTIFKENLDKLVKEKRCI